MRLAGVSEIHDQHDPAFARLEVPLVDLAGEIETRGGAHFRRHDSRVARCRSRWSSSYWGRWLGLPERH